MTDVSTPPPATDPPHSIVESGEYRFGTYNGPITSVNQLDAVGAHPIKRALRSARMKEWEAFQLGDDDWFVLGAVYNAKATGLIQVLAVNKHQAAITRWEKLVPSWKLSVARGLSGTRSRGRSGGFAVSIGNNLTEGRVTVDATHPGSGDLAALELHGTGRCGADDAGHLVIVHPFADGRSLYSHKAMMPFGATLRIGTDEVGLSTGRGFLIIDDHHGEYPQPMVYDWLTGVRRGADGRIEGFNLTDNQVVGPDEYNENAVWLGNQTYRLPAITIDRPDGPFGRWHAHDREGAVDVRFTPTVRSSMHVGPRRILAEYYAPYGWFEGTIETAAVRLVVDGFFGVGEQKTIRL